MTCLSAFVFVLSSGEILFLAFRSTDVSIDSPQCFTLANQVSFVQIKSALYCPDNFYVARKGSIFSQIMIFSVKVTSK